MGQSPMRAEHHASSVEAVRGAWINGARIEKNHNTTVKCDINVTDIILRHFQGLPALRGILG